MNPRAYAIVVMLGFAGCDDEVVGFAEVTNDGASTGAAGASTGQDPSTSSSTGASLEDSSSGLAAQEGLPDYVAYGFEAGLAVSFEDGEAWTDVPALGEMPLREAMVRGEDRIVVVGGDRSATTLDGFAWDVSTFDVSGYARAVAYGSGGFASVGFDHFAWSEDGQTWSDARGDLMGLDLVALAYGGGRFVAVGIDQVVTSENGQDWSATEAVGEKLTSVVFGDGRFVAVGELGRILETQDGVTILRDEASGLAGLGTIRFCDDTFVIGTANLYWLSSDADDWTEVASVGDGAFACSGTSWVLAKLEGLFWAPELGVFSPAHTAKSVFYEVEFTGLGSP